MSSNLNIFGRAPSPPDSVRAADPQRPLLITLLAVCSYFNVLVLIGLALWVCASLGELGGFIPYILFLGAALLAAALWFFCGSGLWKLRPFGRTFLLASSWIVVGLGCLVLAEGLLRGRHELGPYVGTLVAVAVSVAAILYLRKESVRALFLPSGQLQPGRKFLTICAALVSMLVQTVVLPSGFLLPLMFVHRPASQRELSSLDSAPPPPPAGLSSASSGGSLSPGALLGVPGGVPGGQMDGVIGGIIGGVNVPPPPKAPPKPLRVRVGGDVQAAKRIGAPMPIYPPIARTARVSGTVILHAIIGKDGTVQQLQVMSGPPLLVQAAIDAVRQWRYTPTLLNGKPVEVDTTIDVVFTLN